MLIELKSGGRCGVVIKNTFLSNVDIQSFKTVSKEFRSANSATQLTFKPDTPDLNLKLSNYKTPSMIKILNLCRFNVADVDFTRFPQLKEINLFNPQNLIPNQFYLLYQQVKKFLMTLKEIQKKLQ